MPLRLCVRVLMCRLEHKNKESCHCLTGAAGGGAALQCPAERAEGKMRRPTEPPPAPPAGRSPLLAAAGEMERRPAEIKRAT